MYCVVPENIHTPPPTEGIGFSRGGGGGSICLIFQWGGGVTIGKYFQGVLVTCKRAQAAQAHYMNADVTLACKRCCVTNGYLQRFVWDVNGFS